MELATLNQQQQSKQALTIRSHKSILHVRENSLDELEALFDPTKWSNRSVNSLPLNKRNLPASFFRPPETGTKTPRSSNFHHSVHSRQSSVDQTCLNQSANLLSKQHVLLHQKLASLNQSNNHLRSISEPVNISPLAYGIIQQQQQHQQLPYGWQAAKTSDGQTYYIK